MSSSVLSRQEMDIETEDDISVVRKQVRTLAEQRGFSTFAAAALTTATSELSRNIVVHAKAGIAVIEELVEDERVGIRVQFRDHGPGIPDVKRVMDGGYSTMNSLGLGLSGSRRLVDDFVIETAANAGTVITITKWKRTL